MLGNIIHGLVMSFTNSFEEVSANTTEFQEATVTGVRVGDFILVEKATDQNGLTVTSAKATADNTAKFKFVNNTGSGITPTASDTYRLLVFRPELPVRSNAVN